VYNVYWIGARFTADLRRRIYDHLLTLSPGFYEDIRTGEVSSRVTNDVTLIEAVMGGTLLYALRMAITMVGCVVMLFFTSVKLTLLALVGMPVVLLPIGLLGTRVRTLSREVQRAAGASERLLELLATESRIRAPSHPRAMPSPPVGRIVFDDVTFHYPSRPATPALDHFALAVQPGEVVALVGPSGAGKTTV